MKRLASAIGRDIVSSLLTVSFLIATFFILQLYLPGMLTSPTIVPTTSPTQSTTTVITPTLSYGDALKTYEGVATSAIRASERALDTIKWLVGAFFALTSVAAGVAAYLYKTAREAGEKAQLAEMAANEAKTAASATEQHIKDLTKQYIKLSERYIEISQQYVELKGKTLSLDSALEAWERGEISRGRFIEAQQWHSWQKWIERRDDTGWQELWETINYGDGLAPTVRSAVEMELEKIRTQAHDSGTQSVKEKSFEKQLRLLLSP